MKITFKDLGTFFRAKLQIFLSNFFFFCKICRIQLSKKIHIKISTYEVLSEFISLIYGMPSSQHDAVDEISIRSGILFFLNGTFFRFG